MIIRAKAPLRIGLAGGGTDVSPFCDRFGGAVLNATISMYASATIIPRTDGKIVINAFDLDETLTIDSAEALPINGKLDLIKGVYNRVVRQFSKRPLSFEMTTYVDAPKGSGMGASSAVTVAMIGAFAEWLQLPLGEYDIANLAYEIERVDLAMAGGRQDQYAATFGGFNYMEFFADNKVIVNPLRIREAQREELNFNLLLYYTGTSRLSSSIVAKQAANFQREAADPLAAAHRLKEQAQLMKESLLVGNLETLGEILDFGWQSKKKMANGISNPFIEDIYRTALAAGATGGKISGAGGGGFMTFYAPENNRYAVMAALERFGGTFRSFSFVEHGMISWRVA
jgi:D-glycero-alpha-D-manno-heptose-7-phosphate kinase